MTLLLMLLLNITPPTATTEGLNVGQLEKWCKARPQNLAHPKCKPWQQK